MNICSWTKALNSFCACSKLQMLENNMRIKNKAEEMWISGGSRLVYFIVCVPNLKGAKQSAAQVNTRRVTMEEHGPLKEIIKSWCPLLTNEKALFLRQPLFRLTCGKNSRLTRQVLPRLELGVFSTRNFSTSVRSQKKLTLKGKGGSWEHWPLTETAKSVPLSSQLAT